MSKAITHLARINEKPIDTPCTWDSINDYSAVPTTICIGDAKGKLLASMNIASDVKMCLTRAHCETMARNLVDAISHSLVSDTFYRNVELNVTHNDDDTQELYVRYELSHVTTK